MKTVAVFGGTFNPIHTGHIQMLSAICELPFIDQVLVIPTKIPPHKTVSDLASDEDRMKMLSLVCDKFDKAKISDIELKRPNKSYTFDTLSELIEIYPESKLLLCIGGDMVTSFRTWYRYTDILRMASLVVFRRRGESVDIFDEAVAELRKEGAEIDVIDIEITNVSSTFIRENISRSESVRNLLSKEVFDYITDNKIYGE